MRGHATQVAALSQIKKEQDPEEEEEEEFFTEEELLLEDGRLLCCATCDRLFPICRLYTKQFFFPLWTSADKHAVRWTQRQRNSEWILNEGCRRPGVLSKGRCASRKPGRDFSHEACAAHRCNSFCSFSARSFRESLAFCHFYVLLFPPLISSLILFICSYYCAGHDVFFWYVYNFFTGSPTGRIKVTFINFTSRILRWKIKHMPRESRDKFCF